MISTGSYCQTRNYKEALLLFAKMKNSGVLPDQLILATVLSLSACGHDIRHLRTGRAIHSYMLVSDILISAHLSSALINLYATCANMEMAEKLYNGMPSKDLVHTEKLRLLALYLCEHGNWEHRTWYSNILFSPWFYLTWLSVVSDPNDQTTCKEGGRRLTGQQAGARHPVDWLRK